MSIQSIRNILAQRKWACVGLLIVAIAVSTMRISSAATPAAEIKQQQKEAGERAAARRSVVVSYRSSIRNRASTRRTDRANAGRVVATVVSAKTGEPVGHLLLHFRRLTRGHYVAVRGSRTNEAGVSGSDRRPTEFEITASRPGDGRGRVQVAVSTGKTTTVTLTLHGDVEHHHGEAHLLGVRPHHASAPKHSSTTRRVV